MPAPEASSSMQIQELTESSFAPFQGTTCKLYVADEAPPVEVEIGEGSRAGRPRDGFRAPFTVLFLGPRRRHRRPGPSPLEHEGLGRLALFLVPVGPEPSGRHRYEAVFT